MAKFCQHPSTNHSTDMLTIFYGATEPLTLCGYHATHNLNSVLSEIKAN